MTRVAVAVAWAAPFAVGFDFPSISIGVPKISTGSSQQMQNFDSDRPVSASCSPQNLSQYPSGWPTKLDWGIYWFAPGGRFKKATPRQQVQLMDPTTWFNNGDQYDNSTERLVHEFFDPSRKTVIYFHGWSGTGAWSTSECRRVTANCGPDLCPAGSDHDLAAPWLNEGWNVGFFYWDQFADEPCMRDAEQKIWFDRKGNGLRWTSFNPANRSVRWEQYQGEEESIADLCVTAVKSAIGGFYSGSTVRFVGRSIGSQLAVSCAAKLHEEQNVAAPQRLALLDPFFTSKEFSFLGTGIRCGKVTSETGIGGFTQEATANYVKMLWLDQRVVTEVYTSTDESSDSSMDSQATIDMQTYAVQVAYKPSWCENTDNKKVCQHRAVFPLYFLAKALPPPPIVDTAPGRTLQQQAALCEVPSASCSDRQLRTLVEMHLQQTAAAAPSVKEVWEQVGGTATFKLSDDTFSLTGPSRQALATITAEPAVEQEVEHGNAMAQRQWGLGRRWHLGPESGMSYAQLRVAMKTAAALLLFPLLAFITYRLGRLAIEKGNASSKESDDDNDDDEESDVEEGSPDGSRTSRDSKKAALMSDTDKA